ncbi:hypothetical protein LHJ74_04000 [Streptomyces sp. N2-109]|uniref:Uncharacterized protein n=1 Tax=Streptomyces gossypii TaxID=2883101 RepID=A0ABT2JMY5_9ACTN|nr:hypothetical protein [Streptomyces gossypii]MCT2589106.1 hypothetical protein [Streptomyces gossypii]
MVDDQPRVPGSEFFTSPPVHADLRPALAGRPPIWIGGASEAAMRRGGRSGVGWLGFDGLPTAASINGRDEGSDRRWSIARRAAQDAGRDPDALKTAMRTNTRAGHVHRLARGQIASRYSDIVPRAKEAPDPTGFYMSSFRFVTLRDHIKACIS